MTTPKNKHITVKLLRELIEQIDYFLETEKGKRFGGRPDFIEQAINELLREYEKTHDVKPLRDVFAAFISTCGGVICHMAHSYPPIV